MEKLQVYSTGLKLCILGKDDRQEGMFSKL